MDETLKKSALEIINNIFDKLNCEFEEFESDLIDGVLTIQDADDKTYVISFHEPTSQIWYSSPLSGAHHFNLNISNEQVVCVNTRNNDIFFPDLFFNEIES
tara:strand:+ start:21 stop:323 length:303 start_codon:yes stop_codon:yes gene_type:complete